VADLSETIIDEIHRRLDEISGGHIPHEIGVLKRNQHDKPPKVSWVEAPSSVSSALVVGGNAGDVATDEAVYDVTIWQVDKAECRNTLHNLIRAARDCINGPNIGSPMPYEWSPDAHLKLGRQLTLEFRMLLPVPRAPQPTAVVNAHGHTVTVAGEVVC